MRFKFKIQGKGFHLVHKKCLTHFLTINSLFSSTINNQRSFFLLFWLTRENQFHKIIYWISDRLCNLFKWMYKLNMYKKYSHIFCVDMQCSVYCYTSQVSFSSCTSIFNKFWFWMCFFFLQDFLQKLIRLLDSPSVVIRAKAFVVIHEVVKNNYDLLLNSCQLRYINLFKVEIRHS